MSLEIQHDPKNEADITYWNSAGGRRWVERQQSQDIVLGRILQATLERAQLRQGEIVVDIGCGTGASSIALPERAHPSRQVGPDVSAPMLARTVATRRSNSYARGARRRKRRTNLGCLQPDCFACGHKTLKQGPTRAEGCEHDKGAHCPDRRDGMVAERRFEALWRRLVTGVCLSPRQLHKGRVRGCCCDAWRCPGDRRSC